MSTKKTIYIVSVVPPRDKVWTPTDSITGGQFYVYGAEDLKRCMEAAAAAGVTLTIRPAPKD